MRFRTKRHVYGDTFCTRTYLWPSMFLPRPLFSLMPAQLSNVKPVQVYFSSSVCPLPYVHPPSWFSEAEKGCIAKGINCRQVGGSEAEDMKRRGEGKENFSSYYLLSNVLSNRCLLNTLLLPFFLDVCLCASYITCEEEENISHTKQRERWHERRRKIAVTERQRRRRRRGRASKGKSIKWATWSGYWVKSPPS